ncbi:T9SS type A sorting domain-containing protein [Hymenobacter busanensis]|uniref:T9SS type A sorting domain-containing protein n=1 Tax=Hymenobacter busanensis TaxID=2607656 RepID=A0A7L4ZW18_9BACT|nr:T9SS type A sorting domain-containing protein [Hymenobacter busanensis]KAA9325363.1 T9SS type A sorting domain-containing protein [Hymenobacter busanensis]QHJ07644.1 T9SS type A sorting domain-containing protein [Hymenobacter busanensis]
MREPLPTVFLGRTILKSTARPVAARVWRHTLLAVFFLLSLPTAWAQTTAPEGGTLSGSTTVCSGTNSGTLTLSGYTGTIVKYQINTGSGFQDVSGTSTTFQYTNVATTTSYRAVVLTPDSRQVASTEAVVTVSPTPSASISANGSTSFCGQGTLNLSAGPSGSGLTYQFLLNGQPISGATNQTYSATVTSSGNYSVRVTNGANCSATSAAIPVTVNGTPAVTLAANGPTTVCQGNSVSLTATASSNFLLQYYRDGVQIAGASSNTYNATTSGTYTVVAYDPNSCSSTSNAVAVTVTPATAPTVAYSASTYCQNAGTTPTPTTSVSGGTFTSTSGLSLNASTGAINLAASTPGTYTVTYTTSGACGGSGNTTVTISNAGNAAFAYAASTFCVSGTNPTPTVSGTSGGTFSSASGLSLNASTGAINLSASTPGTYTVTYSVGGACPASSTQTVTINSAPAAAFSYASAAYCTSSTNPTPTIASGSAAGTFSSTSGLSLNASTGAINLAASTPGTYTVTNTVAASGGCAASTATTTVTINATPTATLTAGGPTTFCQGGSVVLTAGGGASGATYQFLLNGQPISGATSATYSATTGGSYAVAITNPGSCSATSSAVAVAVNPAASAAFAYAASTFCVSGTNPTPTVSGTAGGTFSSASGLSLNAATGAINLAASTPGTYSVTYAVGGACPASSTQTVTITTAPLASFSYAGTSYCTSGTNPAPAFGTGASAGTFSSASGLSLNAATGVITLAASTPGTYSVTNTIAAAGGCAAASATTTVTITAAPNAALTAGGSTTICQGNSVTLTATGGASGATYQFLLNGQPISGATSATYSASTAGVYTVTVTNPGSCSATSAAVNVTVTPATTPTVAYGASTYCQNAGTTPTPTTSVSGGSFSSASGLSLNASTGVINLAASTPGTYTVTYAASGACAGSGTTTVTITAPATAGFAYSTSTFCASGTNPSPTVSGTSGGTFSSASGLSLNASTGAINLSASTPGTYTVTYSVGGACPASSTQTVTITTAPLAAFNYPSATYCAGSTGTVTPSFGTGASAGTFSSTSGLSLNASTGVINLAASTPGTYTVTNTIAASGGCAASTATATVNITPAASSAFSYSSGTYCVSGTNPTPTVSGTSGGTFSSTSGLSLNTSTGAINLAASTPGTYTVTYAVSSACGSSSTQTVTITTAPLAAFSYGSAAYCTSGTNPAPTFGAGASAGTFSSTSGLSLNASTGVINLSASAPGTYTVTNTIAASGGCTASTASATVTINTAPTASLTTTGSTTFCQGGSVTLTALGGSAGATYQFLLNGQPISGATSATYSATTGGTYSVIVTNAGGCTATSAATSVTVNPTPVAPTLTAVTQPNGSVLLTSSAASGNQFYLNGTPVAGATGQTYLVASPLQNGPYTVATTSTSGCPSAASNAVNVTVVLAAKPLAGSSLQVYPNPTHDGRLTVELTGYRKPVQLTVVNALGQVVFRQEVKPASSGLTQQTVDLSTLPHGVYVLRLVTEGGTDTRRIVHE